MIAEFERRIREMPEPMVQVSYAAMVLAATDATNDRSFAWFDDRAQAALKELERRGSKPRPLPDYVVAPAGGRPSPNRSLTQEQAEQIRRYAEHGVPALELAQNYGVREITIRRILTNENYRSYEEAL